MRVAKQLGPGHTVVTVLCDGGAKYQSRLFNREWLATKKLDTFAVAAGRLQPIKIESAFAYLSFGVAPSPSQEAPIAGRRAGRSPL